MLFHLPADAVSAGPSMTGEGYEAQIFMNEKFVIVLATLDLDTIEANIVPAEGQNFVRRIVTNAADGQPIEDASIAQTTMDWALQLLGAADANTAFAIINSATSHTAPDSGEQLRIYNETLGYISTSRNGTGIFVSTMLNQGVADADPYELGVEIASSVMPVDTAVQE